MSGNSLIRLFAAGFCLLAANAFAAVTIKIAHIDPLSGPFALQGESGSRQIPGWPSMKSTPAAACSAASSSR